MKIFFTTIFIFTFVSQCLCSTDFERIDSVLTESTKVMVFTAEKKVAWDAEKTRLLSLLKSYEALLKSKKNTLRKLQLENSKIESGVKSISEKIARDELELSKISALLDSCFSNLQKNKIAVKILKENSFDIDAFSSKNIPEKLSFLCRAYSKLYEVDTALNNDGTNVSTGVFTSATGKVGGDTVVLKLKGERNE